MKRRSLTEHLLRYVTRHSCGRAAALVMDRFDMRLAVHRMQLCDKQVSPPFDGLSHLVKHHVGSRRHCSHLARGRLGLDHCGFCQHADAVKDLSGIEAALTGESLPVPPLEIIAPA